MYYTSSTDMEILAATTGTPAETKRSKGGIILIQIWTGLNVHDSVIIACWSGA